MILGYQTQNVAKAIETKDFDKALALRDPEFEESLRAFGYISKVDEAQLLPADKRLRFGIIQ